jgi:glutathione S-transferase
LYKYADRYPDKSREYYRQAAEVFLEELEIKLNKTTFLLANSITFVDMAVFPFIRQFAFVDKNWFDASKYKKLQKWLEILLNTSLFNDVMKKHPVWSRESTIRTLL